LNVTCDEAKDLISLYASGALPDDEATALCAHLASGCPRCAGALAEAQATVAHLALSLPPGSASPAAWQAIESRITAAAKGAPGSHSAVAPAGRIGPAMAATRPRGGVSWFSALSMSAIAAAVGALIVGGLLWNQIRDLSQDAQPADARQLQFVSLSGQQQPQAHGHVLWDLDHRFWHVCVFDLKPLPAGKTYELWFITDQGKKVRAGTMDIGPSGEAMVNVPVPDNIGRVTVAALTDEIAGGVDQPQGQIQLLGKVE
jgi:anti-sigma-K factor RskA